MESCLAVSPDRQANRPDQIRPDQTGGREGREGEKERGREGEREEGREDGGGIGKETVRVRARVSVRIVSECVR